MEEPLVKLLKQGVALAMLGAGLVAAPALQAQAMPTATSAAAGDNGVQAMKNEATGLVAVSARAPPTGWGSSGSRARAT